MKKQILTIKHKQLSLAALICATLLTLMGFMILPSSAQINSQQKYIYLSGQLTSSNTGAPIADHDIYIISDSLANGGFSYYATAKTDVNGFYWDTLVTNTADGIIKIYLYDFDNIQIQLDRYYRFVWENEYMMFADFSIFDPDANTELQANFMANNDPLEENPLKVLFKDQSIGLSVKSWFWDFGDGKTSTVQDPEHIYDQTGVYMVSLTINALPPEFQGYESSTITKQVQVGLREYHHMGGHVFAQYFPIDLGLAYLYTFDEDNNLIPIDTTQIDTLGYYWFYAVPAGKYTTKARLQKGSVNYGKFIPTYFGDVYNWEDAGEIIMEGEDNFECNIALLPSTGLASGTGKITGQISYDTSLIIRTPIPAGNVEIVLLSEQGALKTCGLSDYDGYFQFSDIPFGTYQLFPDVAGIPTTAMYVTISEDKPLVDDINMIIYPGEITFSIHENVSDFVEGAMLIYPNPVTDQARISLEAKKSTVVTVMITDISGRTIFSRESQVSQGRQEIILPVRELPAGMYQVLLIPEDKVMISGKFLKSN
jgi:hypothetical protein